ncbi:ryncolin-4-like [Mytilus californianus]|uniref:ryncolin-4-like n=1 Tax=Mytilus californianus TaxID=6549 RepID=UPI0022486A81|nr:ryncolin-4-like [Mytilus californianus]XP_052106724.1 ryncolin-4-like [Mytilus californianus]
MNQCCVASYEDDTQKCIMNSQCYPSTERSKGMSVIQRLELPKCPLLESNTLQLLDCNDLPEIALSGVYTVYPDNSASMKVYCDKTNDSVGWTVVQRRFDGSVYFYRDWESYKNGFGDIGGEFWLGNEKLHILTSRRPYMVRFDFVDLSNEKAYATYSEFSVQNESSNYRLHISGYEGTAGDSMTDYRWNSLNGRMFTTKDRDNDIREGDNSATKFTRGGFWHGNGLNGNINGLYQRYGNRNHRMTWRTWRWTTLIRSTRMMIKPTCSSN